MKRTLIISFVLTLLSLVGANAAVAPLLNYKFADNSLLSSGKWVKISIAETGVYEISYDQLREMGFENPAGVSVFGRGGGALTFNFRNKENNQNLYQDNPEPVRVLHSNNKLLFYAVGPEDMTLSVVTSSDTNKKVTFSSEGRNIYNDDSYYFLTDSQPVTTVPQVVVDDKSEATELTTGYTYFYHECDLTQSSNGMGQLFWGEPLSVNSPLSFSFDQPYSVNQAVYLFFKLAMGQGTGGTLAVNFNNFVRSGTSLTSVSSLLRRFALDAPSVKLQINDNNVGHADLKISVDANYSSNRTLALDWVTVTCPINLEYAVGDKNFTQQYISYPVGTNTIWKCRVPDGSVAWDITGRAAAQALQIEQGYAYNRGSSISEIVVFNPKAKQKEIDSWTSMENQNLHALQTEGVEMIIFTTPELKEYADRIADAHLKYDGIKVVVVTPQQVYDEFSNGSADPKAYRAFAKMLYQSPGNPLKNVMIFGRVTPDLRNVANDNFSGSAHPTYQTLDNNIQSECLSLFDYYGIMSDYVEVTSTIQTAPISIGVGFVPVFTKEEAANVASKITEYLAKEDFSTIVNESLIVGCDGDEHLHEVQSADFASRIQDQNDYFGSRNVHHHIEFDKLSKNNAVNQFKDALSRGKLFGLYFGHAMINGLGKNDVVLGCNELLSADNKDLGFFFFAGCDLANPAKGKQGFGDMGVTRAKRGFIASICSTSQVMSNDNESLAIAFYNSLYYDKSKRLRTKTPTIGEAYAQAKDSEISNSQLSYLLIGDPAIRLPLTLGRVNMQMAAESVHPGDVVTLTGSVLDSEGQVNTDYNGYVTLKLMEPSYTVEVPVSKPKPADGSDPGNYKADMTDFRLIAVKGEVKDGRFTVALPVPEKASAYMSTAGSPVRLPVYASTYDPTNKLGCSGISSLLMAEEGTENSDPNADNNPPAIRLAYDELLQTISVSASDDVALMPGIGNGASVSLSLAGRDYVLSPDENPEIAVTNYNASVTTAHLKPGSYTVNASVRDVAGNLTNADPLHIVIVDLMKMKLVSDADLVVDQIKFNLSGNVPNDLLTLYIFDNDGRVVYSSESDQSEIICDVSDFAPGRYRAAMRHESAKGARLHSNWVEFTVID